MITSQLIENIIPKSYQDEIENVLMSETFPWYYNSTIGRDQYSVEEYKNPLVSNPIGWTHLIFWDKPNSEYFNLVRPIMFFLEEKTGLVLDRFIRIRIRKTCQTPGHKTGMYNIPHVDLLYTDISTPYQTLVYYVNDSDGDTVIFKERYSAGDNPFREKVTVDKTYSPIKGNAVLFDGHMYHAGNAPVLSKDRTIINIDFSVR